MKKKLSAFVGLMLLAVLCSCGKNTAYLDPENYGEDFHKRNEVLFFNESCEHSLVYVSAAGLSDTYNPNGFSSPRAQPGIRTFTVKRAAFSGVSVRTTFPSTGYRVCCRTCTCMSPSAMSASLPMNRLT